jgi:acyl-CoA synthetase (AMP-forming)/AMP-acid ligase II
MQPTEQLLRHAAECEEMARFTRDLESKVTWRRMAERWRRCAEVLARESSVCRERANERRKHAAAA